MNIKDRTGESFPGQVIQHGCSHLKTSDPACCETPGDITGEGPTQGKPEVPSYRPYSEVADVEGGGEPCSAITASEGGEAGPGSIHQGDGTQKAVTAHLDGRFGKNASVSSHPQLLSAHRHASITAADHDKMHRPVDKCGIKTGQPSADTVTMPVVAHPTNQKPVTSRSM